ncbi:hypothetical protein TIFTF001_015208 [Ficus carica]|uniref:Uncharacterized protein n=1 Tax=Ficus carica TaxID=3494 RepID=A0AA88A5D8_FICCA|nr:hypothetical protein TIFTF001_015208 [Ficus carica]
MVGVPLQLAVGFDDTVASVAGQLAVVQSWITTASENSWVTEESENDWRRWEWRRESSGFSSAQTSAISATSEEPSFAREVTDSPEPLLSAGSVRVSNSRNQDDRAPFRRIRTGEQFSQPG